MNSEHSSGSYSQRVCAAWVSRINAENNSSVASTVNNSSHEQITNASSIGTSSKIVGSSFSQFDYVHDKPFLATSGELTKAETPNFFKISNSDFEYNSNDQNPFADPSALGDLNLGFENLQLNHHRFHFHPHPLSPILPSNTISLSTKNENLSQLTNNNSNNNNNCGFSSSSSSTTSTKHVNNNLPRNHESFYGRLIDIDKTEVLLKLWKDNNNENQPTDHDATLIDLQSICVDVSTAGDNNGVVVGSEVAAVKPSTIGTTVVAGKFDSRRRSRSSLCYAENNKISEEAIRPHTTCIMPPQSQMWQTPHISGLLQDAAISQSVKQFQTSLNNSCLKIKELPMQRLPILNDSVNSFNSTLSISRFCPPVMSTPKFTRRDTNKLSTKLLTPLQIPEDISLCPIHPFADVACEIILHNSNPFLVNCLLTISSNSIPLPLNASQFSLYKKSDLTMSIVDWLSIYPSRFNYTKQLQIHLLAKQSIDIVLRFSPNGWLGDCHISVNIVTTITDNVTTGGRRNEKPESIKQNLLVHCFCSKPKVLLNVIPVDDQIQFSAIVNKNGDNYSPPLPPTPPHPPSQHDENDIEETNTNSPFEIDLGHVSYLPDLTTYSNLPQAMREPMPKYRFMIVSLPENGHVPFTSPLTLQLTIVNSFVDNKNMQFHLSVYPLSSMDNFATITTVLTKLNSWQSRVLLEWKPNDFAHSRQFLVCVRFLCTQHVPPPTSTTYSCEWLTASIDLSIVSSSSSNNEDNKSILLRHGKAYCLVGELKLLFILESNKDSSTAVVEVNKDIHNHHNEEVGGGGGDNQYKLTFYATQHSSKSTHVHPKRGHVVYFQNASPYLGLNVFIQFVMTTTPTITSGTNSSSVWKIEFKPDKLHLPPMTSKELVITCSLDSHNPPDVHGVMLIHTDVTLIAYDIPIECKGIQQANLPMELLYNPILCVIDTHNLLWLGVPFGSCQIQSSSIRLREHVSSSEEILIKIKSAIKEVFALMDREVGGKTIPSYRKILKCGEILSIPVRYMPRAVEFNDACLTFRSHRNPLQAYRIHLRGYGGTSDVLPMGYHSVTSNNNYLCLKSLCADEGKTFSMNFVNRGTREAWVFVTALTPQHMEIYPKFFILPVCKIQSVNLCPTRQCYSLSSPFPSQIGLKVFYGDEQLRRAVRERLGPALTNYVMEVPLMEIISQTYPSIDPLRDDFVDKFPIQVDVKRLMEIGKSVRTFNADVLLTTLSSDETRDETLKISPNSLSEETLSSSIQQLAGNLPLTGISSIDNMCANGNLSWTLSTTHFRLTDKPVSLEVTNNSNKTLCLSINYDLFKDAASLVCVNPEQCEIAPHSRCTLAVSRRRDSVVLEDKLVCIGVRCNGFERQFRVLVCASHHSSSPSQSCRSSLSGASSSAAAPPPLPPPPPSHPSTIAATSLAPSVDLHLVNFKSTSSLMSFVVVHSQLDWPNVKVGQSPTLQSFSISNLHESLILRFDTCTLQPPFHFTQGKTHYQRVRVMPRKCVKVKVACSPTIAGTFEQMLRIAFELDTIPKREKMKLPVTANVFNE